MDEHAHCEICQRTIKVGDAICDDRACFDKKEEAQAAKKRTVYIFIALIVGVVLLNKFIQI